MDSGSEDSEMPGVFPKKSLEDEYEKAEEIIRESPFIKEPFLLGLVSEFEPSELRSPSKIARIMVVFDKVFAISHAGQVHGSAVSELNKSLSSQFKEIFRGIPINSQNDSEIRVKNIRNCGAEFRKAVDIEFFIETADKQTCELLAIEVGHRHEDMNMLLLEGEILLNSFTDVPLVLLVNVMSGDDGSVQSVRYMLCKRVPQERQLTYEEHIKKYGACKKSADKYNKRRQSEQQLLILPTNEISSYYDLVVIGNRTVFADDIVDVTFRLDYSLITNHALLAGNFVGEFDLAIPATVSEFIFHPFQRRIRH